MTTTAPATDGLLELRGVDAFYGRVQALHGISITVSQSEIVALIGSNGAGKTTTLRTISGLMHPANGSISFAGQDITRTRAHEIVTRGICQSPEGRRLFPRMQVIDNLRMGAFTRKDKAGIAQDMDRVFATFPRLRERMTQLAGTLSGGEQQMLAIGRALMSRPKLLMLDEPSLGLAPLVVQEVLHTIRLLNERGLTILLVEQNVAVSLKISARAYVLENGRIVMSGAGSELLHNDRVRQAYLGL